MLSKFRRIWLWILSWLLLTQSCFADFTFNMTQGVTKISHDVYHLHMIIFSICVIIGIIVYSILIFSLIKYRKSAGHKAATFHESTTVEIIWTIIPFIILVIMAIPATKVLIAMHDTRNAELDIKVTGYQWRWQYEYLGEHVSFFSDLTTPQDQINNLVKKGKHYLREVNNPVVVPIDTKIRFLFTSNDVIHSWWVPDLGWKKDAVPGFINESWSIIDKPGIYRGQCAELCGIKHGFMPIVVVAKTKSEFKKWLQQHRNVKQKKA